MQHTHTHTLLPIHPLVPKPKSLIQNGLGFFTDHIVYLRFLNKSKHYCANISFYLFNEYLVLNVETQIVLKIFLENFKFEYTEEFPSFA